MGFRKDFRELISFFSNRPKGYIPDQESVGGDRVKIGGISNKGSETIENSGVNKSDSLHLLHAKTPLHGAFCMEQIKNRTRDVSLSESKEGSGPGVHLYAHPENGSQGSKTANAAPSGVLDGRIFPSPAPIISVFIKIHKIW